MSQIAAAKARTLATIYSGVVFKATCHSRAARNRGGRFNKKIYLDSQVTKTIGHYKAK